MKKLSSLLIVFVFTLSFFGTKKAHGQLEQGTKMIGASIANLNFNLEGNGTYLSISPQVGYFVADGIAVGGSLPISLSGSSSDDSYAKSTYRSNSMGLGVFGRYYFMESDPVSVFGGLGFGFGVTNWKSKYTVKSSGISTSTSGSDSYTSDALSLGAVYFIADNVGLEGVLSLNDLISENSANINLGVGVQVYFP